MCPHPNDLDSSYFFQDLIDKTVLNIDALRRGSGEVSNEFFIGGRSSKWIFRENMNQSFNFLPQTCCVNFLGVLLSLLGIDNPPLYHPGFSLHFLTGVFKPFRMDSLIPGIDKRYNVS